MTHWRDEYLNALRESEEKRRAQYPRVDHQLIEEFTTLLDHVAASKAEKAAQAVTSAQSKPTDATLSNKNEDNVAETAHLKSDLAETLRSRAHINSLLKATEAEVTKLRGKIKSDAKVLEELSNDRTVISQKLRDRDEELLGKTKLLGEVQDEVISLNLQLNMSEQKARDLGRENKFLIDRWMLQKRHEAEEMNNSLA